MKTVLSRAGFDKRPGPPMGEVIFGLVPWLWLKKDSIGMFAGGCLQGGLGKDAPCDTMGREDLGWRKYHGQVACKTVRTFRTPGKTAYVADDSAAQRFGKKMPGLSGHTGGRQVVGQQALTLGLSCGGGFVPWTVNCSLAKRKPSNCTNRLGMAVVLPPNATVQPNKARSLGWSTP
jgi:hypothetical protein